MFKKVVIASLFFALVFLCACAGSEYTPDHEATPQPNTGTSEEEMSDQVSSDMPWSLVGTVSIVSNGTEHEPYIQFEHAGMSTSQGQMSGSPPAPPSIDELLEMLPKIQYSDDFQVVVDGAYASKITYSLSETEEFRQSISEGLPLIEAEELHIPEADGSYILVVRVHWSNPESPENYVINSYISTILRDPDLAVQNDLKDLVHADLVVDGLILDDEEVFQVFSLDDKDSLLWIENTFGPVIEHGNSSSSESMESGCPFWAALNLTRSDGAVITIYPAVDDCRVFLF